MGGGIGKSIYHDHKVDMPFSSLKGGDVFTSNCLDGKLRKFMKLREAYHVGEPGKRGAGLKNAVCLDTTGHFAGDLVSFADGVSVMLEEKA